MEVPTRIRDGLTPHRLAAVSSFSDGRCNLIQVYKISDRIKGVWATQISMNVAWTSH